MTGKYYPNKYRHAENQPPLDHNVKECQAHNNNTLPLYSKIIAEGAEQE